MGLTFGLSFAHQIRIFQRARLPAMRCTGVVFGLLAAIAARSTRRTRDEAGVAQWPARADAPDALNSKSNSLCRRCWACRFGQQIDKPPSFFSAASSERNKLQICCLHGRAGSSPAGAP